MPSAESLEPGGLPGGIEAEADLCQLVAAAADLCHKPWHHAVITLEAGCLKLEVRDLAGCRQPDHDLELELFSSGRELHLTIGWCDERPLLWHGNHPVWMDGSSGQRCDRPLDGLPLEALARRLRALLDEPQD